tara:strand:+ start:1598 stop:2308 length:711 start_codon:yes stop_codon:yes gene_type:complete
MVYIIAEAGVDHEGSLKRALQLLYRSVEAGADCFKMQYYAEGYRGEHRELPWLSPAHMYTIEAKCKRMKIDFLLTPHDEWALDYIVNQTECDTIKIGSGDWDLIPKALGTGKDLIISTGNKPPDLVIKQSIELEDSGGDHGILYCVSEYPCPPTMVDLSLLAEWTRAIELNIGYSDHTQGTAIALAAVALDAEIIEKHITLEQDVAGRNDTFCSLPPDQWPHFVEDIRKIEQALAS